MYKYYKYKNVNSLKKRGIVPPFQKSHATQIYIGLKKTAADSHETHEKFCSGFNVASREALSSLHFFYCLDVSSRLLMCSSRLIVHVRAASRGSKHQIAGIVMLWKNLKVLVSQSYNWVSMANDSLNFIVFPLGQSGGTLRQPNYNPRWGGRPWARFHNCLNFLIQLSQGHDTDTNHAKPVRQCWSEELIMVWTLLQII